MAFRITYSVLNADLGELHAQFDRALEAVRARFGAEFPSWVGSEPVRSRRLLESRNPADTRVVLARFHEADAAALDRAVARAREAQRVWGRTPWQERVRVLRRAADLISERRLDLAAVMSLEVGKNRLESLGDVEESADLMRYYAQTLEEANGFEKPLGRLSPNEDTRSVLKPYGVFAVISPFNFPMALAAGMSAGALLGGNAVVHKPSEDTPWVAEGLYEVLRHAGLPDGLFSVLHGKGESLGAALVRHPGIDGVAFTGSAAVGLDIFKALSHDRVKPCLLELGGKNAAIVCEAADVAKAAQGCARSAFGLSGQKCSALSRIYVHASRRDEFVRRLLEHREKIVVGDPTRADVYMGPVIHEDAVARFERAAAEARADGRILGGGERLMSEPYLYGHFVQPTVAEVAHGHRLTREELFLPFVTVTAVRSLDEAIACANDADYGLTAGIFSERKEDVDAFFERVEAGVLYANRETGATTGAWPGVQAFCGWKKSGATGKGGCGPWYVSQFMREQSQTRMT
jgi:1-pyrroline-5-carboxylate dehydrogenase